MYMNTIYAVKVPALLLQYILAYVHSLFQIPSMQLQIFLKYYSLNSQENL